MMETQDVLDAYSEVFERRLMKERLTRVVPPIPCRDGCFYCCKEQVLVTRSEAEHVVSLIKPEDLEAVKARVLAWIRLFKAAGVHKDTVPRDVVAYRAINAWCPLLKDGRCSVYAGRPLGCRGHTATGPVVYCQDDGQRLKQTYMELPELNVMAFAQIASGVADADHLGVWLARLLLGSHMKQSKAVHAVLNGHDLPEG